MLLAREALPVPAAVERLIGLQAQASAAPFIGLWTRLPDFRRDDLAAAIRERSVVKATTLRATLHLVSANDYPWLRATLQPALEKASGTIAQSRGVMLDIPALLAEARRFIGEQPRSFAEITAHFEALMPNTDIGSIRYTIRTHLPLVQQPVEGGWSYPGSPQFTLADAWLGQPVDAPGDFRRLVTRYLAAFGPARVTDIQTWSGLDKLKGAVDALKKELVVYKDEQGVELLDLPDAPLPPEDTPAPERFLPEFDNLLLSHSNRTRVVSDDFRKQVYLPGLRVASTILVDGFVRGAWKAERKKSAAALTITPFAPLTPANRAALTEEGDTLLRFIEPDAQTYEVRFAE
jgi:hypothetical protein